MPVIDLDNAGPANLCPNVFPREPTSPGTDKPASFSEGLARWTPHYLSHRTERVQAMKIKVNNLDDQHSVFNQYMAEIRDVEVEYLASPDLEGKTVILCGPMLATGSSMVLAYGSKQ